MNTDAQSAMNTIFESCGWKAHPLSESWKFAGDGAVAELAAPTERAGWLHLELTGDITADLVPAKRLQQNASLPGPAKLVGAPKNRIQCRCDIPITAEPVPTRSAVAGAIDRRAATVRALTRMVRRLPPAVHDFDPATYAEALRKAGWQASVQAERVTLPVTRSGLFRAIEIESREDGTVATAELLALGGATQISRRAIMSVARELNDRLPLVRISASGLPVARLSAEVHFGGGPVPVDWMSVGLSMIENLVAISARELEALRRDSKLAKLTLAANVA